MTGPAFPPKDLRSAPVPDRLRPLFKAALRNVIDVVGVEAACECTGLKNPGRVSEWTSPATDYFAQPWRIVELERLAGRRSITMAMAAAHGCDLVERGDVRAQAVNAKGVGDAAKETGEALAALGTVVAAVRAGVADRTAAIREIDEAVGCLLSLRASLERDGA